MLMRRAGPGPEREQAGFTLVELVVSMTLLVLILGALLGALDSMTRTERITSTRVDDDQALRLTLAQLTRDVGDANPVQAQPSVGAYPTTADLLLDGPPSTHVQWSFDAGAQTLTRFVFLGPVKKPTAVLGQVTQATFVWLDAAGADLASQPWVTPDDVVRCALELRVTATIASHRGSAPTTQTAQFAIGNQPGNPGGCR